MDYYDFVASAIAAVASLYNANAELAHLQKIGVKDVCVLWCGSTLQNNKAWLSTTVPDCMYYEATYDGDKKELRLDAYRKIQSVSMDCHQRRQKLYQVEPHARPGRNAVCVLPGVLCWAERQAH